MQINTNVIAMGIYNSLKRADRKAGLSMEKLSSGLKINSASDDAAGMAISNKLKTQISGLNLASRNSLDGVSLVQTADGALNEVQSMIQKMRELAVQSATDSYTAEDRLKIQEEVNQLREGIDQLAQNTQFNNIRLFDGSLSTQGISEKNGVRTDIAQVINISPGVPVGKLDYTVVKMPEQAEAQGFITAGASIPEGSFTINGEVVQVESRDTLDDVLKKIKDVCFLSDIEVTTPDYPPDDSAIVLTTKQYGRDASIKLDPADSPVLAALGLDAKTFSGSEAQISDIKFADAAGGNPATFNDEQSVVYNGEYITIKGKGNDEITIRLNPDKSAGANEELSLNIKDSGPLKLQIGPNASMEMEIAIPDLTADALFLNRMNMKNVAGAEAAIKICDEAIATVSAARGRIGAYQNRLEFSITSLRSTETNTQGALSRIMDTDMAAEMTNYTQLSIISQAGMSILAQANQRPQQILQLL